MIKIIDIIIFLAVCQMILLLVFLCIFIPKLYLQRLIIDNYKMRANGLLPDKMYWADRIYGRLYNDYSFLDIDQDIEIVEDKDDNQSILRYIRDNFEDITK